MVDLDTRQREGRRPELDGELNEVQIGVEPSQTTRINKAFPILLKQDLVALLKSNTNLFAWTVADMPRIDPEFMFHQLSLFPRAWLVAEKRRRISPNKALTVQGQVQSLLDVGFVIDYIAGFDDAKMDW